MLCMKMLGHVIFPWFTYFLTYETDETATQVLLEKYIDVINYLSVVGLLNITLFNDHSFHQYCTQTNLHVQDIELLTFFCISKNFDRSYWGYKRRAFLQCH